ncbi:MAG: hypothetical protein C0522_01730 [Rhodocyclaceae bacterium]|jgi:5-methylcytosine-specific restriction endonuclease McrA|nr:hypothetical protein [Rhodocyclaceae bacterium]
MRVAAEIWKLVFSRDRGYCQYCGIDLLESFSSFHSATVDHLVAVSEGGSDEITNLVLSCPACNQMLSRAGHLKTFEKRKALLDQRRQEHWDWYQTLVDELRKDAHASLSMGE